MNDIDPLPGLTALTHIAISTTRSDDTKAVCVLVTSDGDIPAELQMSRDALARFDFEAKVGQTLVLASPTTPVLIAVGAGPADELDEDALRDIGAAAARSTATHGSICLAASTVPLTSDDQFQALVEGVLLARYRYVPLKSKADSLVDLVALAVESTSVEDETILGGAGRARVSARATVVARDLTNTPPARLTATRLGEVAESLAAEYGFAVELFDRASLTALGCGGLLGVNSGSAEEPLMIKLTYEPKEEATGHLGLVGKGITYDSGGISLKPSDPMHLLMKMDMGGAAAVLGAFSALHESGVTAQVTGWLMCTDNMPSGSAMKLGDVLVARGGTTVEVTNTDAEGRLVMMDALVLATEDDVDAIIDIATLTGSALMALGPAMAAVIGNDDDLISEVQQAGARTGEPLWQLPLERKYRSALDSGVADIANLGGKYAGAVTAALFLEHFVGSTPWAHLDIAGTMQTEKDDSWRSAGATGFGARTLLSAAAHFTA